MATDPIDPGAARHSAAVGPVVIDVLLGFPAAPDPWWHDGTIAPALFETLRSHHLWFGFDRAGRAGAELTPMGRDELGAWSLGWIARTTYRIAADELAATHLDLLLARGLRLMLVVSSAEQAAHASTLLDDVAAWLVALRRSDIAGGVRIRRGHVWPLADYPTRGPALEARAWDLGTVLDAIDREAYAGEVAAQYFGDRYATLEEGEAELARLLAAPAPPGSVRVDDGPLVIWKHVADLTDAVAVERARVAQHAWITSLVEVAPA
ncbi:MAG: hypothetical protein IPH44_32505 [Myxococcales bacterium]|nr:hypothetical protein [Myxococcales bacterium]MBP6846782.1 hypothetical protein [Kofleriaceae bacterium]